MQMYQLPSTTITTATTNCHERKLSSSTTTDECNTSIDETDGGGLHAQRITRRSLSSSFVTEEEDIDDDDITDDLGGGQHHEHHHHQSSPPPSPRSPNSLPRTKIPRSSSTDVHNNAAAEARNLIKVESIRRQHESSSSAIDEASSPTSKKSKYNHNNATTIVVTTPSTSYYNNNVNDTTNNYNNSSIDDIVTNDKRSLSRNSSCSSSNGGGEREVFNHLSTKNTTTSTTTNNNIDCDVDEDIDSNDPQRIFLTQSNLNACTKEELANVYNQLQSYIDANNSKHEEEIARLKSTIDKYRSQQLESTRRENVLVMRLSTKEQEMEEYIAQINELKSAVVPTSGVLKTTLVDPAINFIIQKMKKELQETKKKLEDTQNDLVAWKFTPDSNTGKRLMAKCRMLYVENEELGKVINGGRVAKLENDLALQKTLTEEMRKSRTDMVDLVQELDEDVEGMQSTIFYLQQQLRESNKGKDKEETNCNENDLSKVNHNNAMVD